MKAEMAVCKDPEVVMLQDELSQNQEEVRENVSEGKVHTLASENGIDLPVPVLSETDNNGIKLRNKMLGRALDPRANGTWLSKLTE